MRFQRHRRLQYFKNTSLVLETDTALLFRRFPEFTQFFPCPFGLDIPRRNHGDQRGDAPEPLNQRVLEIIISLQFGVTPDAGLLTEELRHANFQSAMQVRDPTPMPLDKLYVVQVGVTNECVPFEVHGYAFKPSEITTEPNVKSTRVRNTVVTGHSAFESGDTLHATA